MSSDRAQKAISDAFSSIDASSISPAPCLSHNSSYLQNDGAAYSDKSIVANRQGEVEEAPLLVVRQMSR